MRAVANPSLFHDQPNTPLPAIKLAGGAQILVDIVTTSALSIGVGDGLPCACTCPDPHEP
jgi:hypothetical protein